MISSSPDRGSFTKGIYNKKVKDGTTTPEYADQMLDFLTDRNKAKLEQEKDPEWQKENLEYDLRTCDWMLDKVRNDDAYAQNLYAALCNNEFIKNDTWQSYKTKNGAVHGVMQVVLSQTCNNMVTTLIGIVRESEITNILRMTDSNK